MNASIQAEPQEHALKVYTPLTTGDAVAPYHLPKPRILMCYEVTETHGGFVLEGRVMTGFGPFKRMHDVSIRGGAWVARASAHALLRLTH